MKKTFPHWSYRKIAQGVLGTVAVSVGLLPAVGGPSSYAVEQPFDVQPIGRQIDTDRLLAQVDQTILSFDNTSFAVRVFTRNNQTLMNVYSKRTNQLLVNAQPAAFVPRSGPNNVYSSYQTLGSFNAQPATFFARVDAVNNTLLDIFDSQNNLLVRESGGNPVVALPANQRPPTQTGGGTGDIQNTRLAFDTASYATRVFEEGGVLKMNVYTRNPTAPVQNGVATTLVRNPETPFQGWVNYVSNGTFQGIPVQYFMRINSRGETRLDVVGANGQTILTQPGLGPVVINIPQNELPPGQTIAPSQNLNPFIAAVFGDEATLEQLQRLQGQFAGTSTSALLQEPQFESAPQGRFINAGSYQNRDQAAAVVSYLRSQGFNARLVYRDFRYR